MAASGWNIPRQAKDPSSLSPSPPDPSPEGQRGGPKARKLHIWLVEDSPTDVFVIREVLSLRGLDYEMTVIPDGDVALNALHGVQEDASAPLPALILLDLNLPKVGGIDVLAALRQASRMAAVPVIVVTSSDSAADLKAIRELGASAYFRKPHDLDEFMRLSDVVEATLKRR